MFGIKIGSALWTSETLEPIQKEILKDAIQMCRDLHKIGTRHTTAAWEIQSYIRQYAPNSDVRNWALGEAIQIVKHVYGPGFFY